MAKKTPSNNTFTRIQRFSSAHTTRPRARFVDNDNENIHSAQSRCSLHLYARVVMHVVYVHVHIVVALQTLVLYVTTYMLYPTQQ